MWKFSSGAPVSFQAAEEIKLRIISGIYKPGQKLPSVQELAAEARLNPNTMKSVIEQAVNDGYIIYLKSSGCYITDDEELIGRLRSERCSKAVKAFLAEMNELGITADEAAELLIQENNMERDNDSQENHGE